MTVGRGNFQIARVIHVNWIKIALVMNSNRFPGRSAALNSGRDDWLVFNQAMIKLSIGFRN
jgi:hypothetical protein